MRFIILTEKLHFEAFIRVLVVSDPHNLTTSYNVTHLKQARIQDFIRVLVVSDPYNLTTS